MSGSRILWPSTCAQFGAVSGAVGVTTGGSAPMMAGFAAVAPVSSISQPKVSLSKTSIWAFTVASE
jgi:hypothetical protein